MSLADQINTEMQKSAHEASQEGLKGPRGGDLSYRNLSPQRSAPLNAPLLANGELGLHKFIDTAVDAPLDEKPWMAMAAALAVEGKSNVFIAQLAGVTEARIAQLKATRWFQEKVALLTNQITGPRIARFAEESDRALNRISELIDCDNDRIALAAATYVCDQTFGKPTQKILSITSTASSANAREEFDSLQQEIEALKKAKGESAVSTDTPPPST